MLVFTGSAAWTGGRHVASFLGEQIYEAAVMAQPHVQSMATSAANALKVAASDSVDTLRGGAFLFFVFF